MEGHPYAKRLSEDEFSLVADLTRMNVAPRDILSILKERNLSNVSTIMTIYNARNKIRMVEQVGKSPMQVLMSLLHSNGYVYEFTTTGLNKLENLFFVHPTSFDIWRAFPHVLIIDATYKTNQYNMPFVQIVGVTSTSKTFSIAFAFMDNEKTDTYTWVLNCLKLTLDKCMHPRVIVTDREMALVNACKEVFPDAAQLLCRWHIEQNIIKYCRQSVRSADDWDDFISLWKRLENSLTLTSYTELESRYHIYEKIFVVDINGLRESLYFFETPAPARYWMLMPEAGVLLANQLGVIVHCLSTQGSTTIFPFWSGPEEFQPHRAITIAHLYNQDHYVMVELQGEYPMPFITPYWNDHRSPSAARWETMYRSRIELFSQLVYRERVFLDVSD